MKAVGYRRSLPITDEASLVDVELPTPDLRPHDLLVRVEAASVNPVDVKVRMRAAPPEGQVRSITKKPWLARTFPAPPQLLQRAARASPRDPWPAQPSQLASASIWMSLAAPLNASSRVNSRS